ncbi:MAG: class I SAM-dependent methyltransferase [Candidatus Pacebacteria bacterium]|nr:class I SAM-dependent methyltransferase [Candidatus Paceibacterota bacterium]
MGRKEYWENNYLKYWQERTRGKKEIIKNDASPADEKIFNFYFKKLNPKPGEKLLDLGCGFGRFFPIFKKKKVKIFGIDISESMIKKAKKDYEKICEELVVSEAEKLPFQSNYFDKIVCWAIFDALFQDKALREINRVLKKGGMALITGKNDNFRDDDQKARIAEINARKKGHPNYFTDFKKLIENLDKFGFKIQGEHYFEKRGYFSKNKYSKKIPGFFYEYLIFLKKEGNPKNFYVKISDKFSKTFKRGI